MRTSGNGLDIMAFRCQFFITVNLLQKIQNGRETAHELRRTEIRRRLRDALHKILPAREVIIFGSLTQPGRFRASSDIDIAIEEMPEGESPYLLQASIEDEIGLPVDLIELRECRFRKKIEEEGERWIS